MFRYVTLVLGFAFVGGAAIAEPVELSEAQLDRVTAGSFEFIGGSAPDVAGAEPVGGQGGQYVTSFGPNSGLHPTGAAWIAHSNPNTPLANGGNN